MRRFAFVLIVLIVFSSALFAQKFGIEGGYSYSHYSGGSTNANGWEAQPMFLFSKHFAVVGDFTGEYVTVSGVTAHLYTYLFGPAYVIPLGKSAMFNVHYLAGGMHESVFGMGINGFAQAAGGALDFKVAKKVYIRPAEVDWLSVHAEGQWANKNFRYGAGVLFMF